MTRAIPTWVAVLAPLALTLGAAGCAAPQAQIPPDVLLRMQSDARREIYDRENDVAIARNRLDDVAQRTAEVRSAIAHLGQTGDRVRTRLGKAGGDKLGKLDKPLAARRAYLDAQIKQLAAQRDVAQALTDVALAKLEQTRQRELVRTGRALGRSMKPFDGAVKDGEQRVNDRDRHESDVRQETEKAYEAWQAAQEEFARATGDFDVAVWTD